jgi:dihydroorotate dehydrogenase
MLYSLARAALFRLDPEVAHDFALKSLSTLGPAAALLGAGADRGRVAHRDGHSLPNPVGLAAGLDKNGEYIDALAALGFGFLEIGTVTPRPQPGNAKPRMFRLVEHEADHQPAGFQQQGVERLLRNVERASFSGVLGINIGKNFDTPNDRAASDYLACLDAVYARASYVTVNISSPNTKNLRDLQSSETLDELLAPSWRARRARRAPRAHQAAAVKVAPDLDDAQIASIAALAGEARVDGLIATNTTRGPRRRRRPSPRAAAGGLSRPPALRVLDRGPREARARARGRVPLIGVGGILGGADARAKIDAGASLVQLYTGFIYRGPALIAEARRALR